jgi:hypothetical protein
MNDTIILGYADERGEGKPKVVCGPEADQIDSINIMDRAKRHRFPEGIKHLKACRLEEYDCAIFIGTNVGDALEAAEKRQTIADKKAMAVAKEDREATEKLEAARQKIQSTAKARNELLGKLHVAETSLRNHDSTPDTLRGKLHDSTVKELQRVILGDPEKKVAGLKAQVEAAIADYETAVEEATKLRVPSKL